jgi:hypothetical protein
MCKIKIIDAIMGAGKTSYAIQLMQEDTTTNYVYITPFLKEVTRVKQSCFNRRFVEPLNCGNGKLDSLHSLLKDNRNIVSTHALFRMSTDVTRELIQSNNYTLILDEVCDVIEQIPLRKNDLATILEYSHIENDFLVWDNMDYDGRYNDIKLMAINKTLMFVNNTLLMWNFPVEVFKAFKEAYVMTYMFPCQIQKYYYDLHNIKYEYYTVTNEESGCGYKLIPFDQRKPYNKVEMKKNINILENDIINNIGEPDYSLSVSWYEKDKNKYLIETLKKNIYNYFQNKLHAKSNTIIWTTYKDYKKKLLGKGYSKAFLSVNARATNEYKERYNVAYCVNIFLNPMVKQFFITKNVTVLEDNYALSEMLQFIWRSAIRDNKPINIYIPSLRMRNLLINWLDNENI